MLDSDRQAFLDRARQGDRQALGELLESYRPYVRALGKNLGHERLRARFGDSDLAQDVVLLAIRSFDSFRGSTVAELTGWLREIVHSSVGHKVRDHLGAGKRAAGREQAGAATIDLMDPGTSPSGKAVREEEAGELTEALAQLPEDMRQVLIWRHVDGLPHADIAERMGRSVLAVRALYTRALRQLREIMAT
jgi:RNA polymerase sigma-70 factor (ECF subfamily)